MVRIFVALASLGVLSGCATAAPPAASAPEALGPATPAAPHAAPSAPTAPVAALANYATITVSASTNTPKIVLLVRGGRDDAAHWQISGGGQKVCRAAEGDVALGGLGATLLNGIPSDVHLKDLPVGSCSKPASFATTTSLDHFGDTSGDLSCPATDPRTAAVAKNVEAVKKTVLRDCNLPMPQ